MKDFRSLSIVLVLVFVGCGSPSNETAAPVPDDLAMELVEDAGAVASAEGDEDMQTALQDSVSPDPVASNPASPVPASSAVEAAPESRLAEEDRGPVFVASLESLLADTRWAGTVFDDPDFYIARAMDICDDLAEGRTSEDVMVEQIEEISGTVLSDTTVDDRILGGALVGSGVGAYCPAYADQI